MSALDQMIARHRPGSVAWIARALALVIVLLGVWSLFAELEEVAVAPGTVVPQGDVKVVQHLEGGIVDALLVAEGQLVSEGQPLVRLKLGLAAQNPAELRVRLDGLELKRARLLAEAGGTEPAFPDGPSQRRPEVLQAEQRAFRARQDELRSSEAVLDQQLRQRGEEIREYRSARDARNRELELGQESLETLQDLARDNLASRLEVNQKQADVARLIGEIGSLEAAMNRAASEQREAAERKEEAARSYRREAQAELADVEVQIATVAERLSGADEQESRTTIRSPIDGIVADLKVSTVGAVIQSGQPILEIVPVGGPLVVEAELSPTDRGFVAVGQRATVKISSYDFIRYGSLDGHVVRIAPDSSLDDQGRPYFKVVVQTDRAYLGNSPEQFPIGPGMLATIDVHTGSRSVVSFLLQPVLKLQHEAFRER